MSSLDADRFMNTDLCDFEAVFLGEKKITDLPVFLDDERVPPSGRPNLDRVVDVDREVERFLSARKEARLHRPSGMDRFVGWLLRG